MIRRQYACARWAGLVCACVSAGALAQTAPPPDAQASDPARLGWMVGSPPPADEIVRKEDGSFYRFPQLRWTFSNARQLGATTNSRAGWTRRLRCRAPSAPTSTPSPSCRWA